MPLEPPADCVEQRRVAEGIDLQNMAAGEVVAQVPTDTKALAISAIPKRLGLVIYASKVLGFGAVLASSIQPNNVPAA